MMKMHCDDCGKTDILSVKPGSEEHRWDGMLVMRGEQIAMLCRICFLRRYGTSPEPRVRRSGKPLQQRE